MSDIYLKNQAMNFFPSLYFVLYSNSFNRIEVVNRDTGEVVADNMVVKPEINDFVEGLQGMLPPFNPYSANNTSLEVGRTPGGGRWGDGMVMISW